MKISLEPEDKHTLEKMLAAAYRHPILTFLVLFFFLLGVVQFGALLFGFFCYSWQFSQEGVEFLMAFGVGLVTASILRYAFTREPVITEKDREDEKRILREAEEILKQAGEDDPPREL